MDFNGGTNRANAGPRGFNLGEGVALWALIILFFAAIVFMLLGKAIPTPPNLLPYLIPKSTRVYSASEVYWPPSGTTTNMTAALSKFEVPQNTSYSFNMDLIIKDSRTLSTSTLHRHIFHRGSADYAGPTPSNTTSLPARMNPGVFLDPLTNDMLVFIDTVGSNGSEGYRESVRIADLPLSVPFHLGLVLNDRTLDVYINCRLEETQFLKGTPKVAENTIYGIMGPSPAPVQLQNLYTWTYPLGADDVSAICGTAPSFVLSPTCGIKAPVPPAVDAKGPKPKGTVVSGLTQAIQSLINRVFNLGTNAYRE